MTFSHYMVNATPVLHAFSKQHGTTLQGNYLQYILVFKLIFIVSETESQIAKKLYKSFPK
jgi:hypothetical protein